MTRGSSSAPASSASLAGRCRLRISRVPGRSSAAVSRCPRDTRGGRVGRCAEVSSPMMCFPDQPKTKCWTERFRVSP